MSIMSRQNQCITCNKSGGIMTCNGCNQTFCGKHVIKHRQELANQLDGLMQEHDLFQQELNRTSNEHTLLQKINNWEKESVAKIQLAAETARTDLRKMIEKSRQQLSQSCHVMASSLRSSREADNFSEIDLDRWMKQLKELQLEIKSPSSIQLTEDQKSTISLITVRGSQNSINKNFSLNKNDSSFSESCNFNVHERFSKVIGSATLDEEGLVVVCNKFTFSGTKVFGRKLYSYGRQTVQFKIERSKTPYEIFFGCTSFQVADSEIFYNSPFIVGWFGDNEVWQHGLCNQNSKEHCYNSQNILTNDVLQLTFDCEQKQIELFHQRTKQNHILPIDVNKTLLPWQLLVILMCPDDCVRILL